VLEEWALREHVGFATRHELVSCSAVQELYLGIVEQKNRDLARFEKLKKVLLVAEEFSSDNGTLTASMKLRRREVERRYDKQIVEMYQQAEASRPGSVPD
jgi:long-chain acyl-CoA synthetase